MDDERMPMPAHGVVQRKQRTGAHVQCHVMSEVLPFLWRSSGGLISGRPRRTPTSSLRDP
jgi:hypothetical protein